MPLTPELEAEITSTKYWFVRESAAADLNGPYIYTHANEVAREMSQDEDGTKQAEIVVYIGTRPGDPVTEPKERVVAYYRQGIQVYTGRTAEWKSDNP